MATKCLQIIEQYYGSKIAKRSGVPYINHIYEGLAVLDYLGVSQEVKDAYCLHPIFQDDETFEKNIKNFYELKNINHLTLIFVMEYRNVANRGLNCFQVDDPDKIYLGPSNAVKFMLIADKVQNRKDFLKYHYNTHPKSKELDIYFKNWLRKLDVTEKDFNKLVEIMESIYKYKLVAHFKEDKPKCSFKEFEQKIGAINYKVVFGIRYGQSIMNTLNDIWKKEYDRISTTDLDCFYDDKIVKFTIEHLKQVWKD